jgi:hypothetical protein
MAAGAGGGDQTPPAEAAASGSILDATVFMRGANRRFGELTADDVRARAQELREAVGWGPTARVAPVAQAWRELSLVLERAGADTVGELPPETLEPLARRLWVVLP